MKLSKKMDSFRCDRTSEFCADDLWSLDDFKKGIEKSFGIKPVNAKEFLMQLGRIKK